MKLRVIVIFTILALSVVMVSIASANNSSHSEEQLRNAGWICGDESEETPPPGHCFPPGTGNRTPPAPTMQVKVFDETGSFLGTEILWHVDIYAGQPCPQDALLDLTGAGLPYIGCHRYPELTAGG